MLLLVLRHLREISRPKSLRLTAYQSSDLISDERCTRWNGRRTLRDGANEHKA
jgi:hypothetical protein